MIGSPVLHCSILWRTKAREEAEDHTRSNLLLSPHWAHLVPKDPSQHIQLSDELSRAPLQCIYHPHHHHWPDVIIFITIQARSPPPRRSLWVEQRWKHCEHWELVKKNWSHRQIATGRKMTELTFERRREKICRSQMLTNGLASANSGLKDILTNQLCTHEAQRYKSNNNLLVQFHIWIWNDTSISSC